MPTSRPEWPRYAAFALAAILGLSIAHSVYRIPIQVSDSLDAIVAADHSPSSLSLLLESSRWSETTLRPMRYLQARWLRTLAESTGLSYHAVFRGTHAALALSLVLLVAWIADPRRWIDVAVVGLSVTVLIGMHTFDAMMREAFPVNHYAEVAVACLFALAVALRPPRLLPQLMALALLVCGLLLIESAALIALVIVACAAVNLPGISKRTAGAAMAIVVGFLAVRAVLGISSPEIGGHSSGWQGTVLSGEDVKARFADNPLPYYAYNITSGLLSVVISEPQFGVYRFLIDYGSNGVPPVAFIQVTASLLVSAAILVCLVSTRGAFRHWSNDFRVLVVGVVVIGASAALCINYVKDDIVSTAGVFFAVMCGVAARWALGRIDANPTGLTSAALLGLALSAPLWAFRVVGTHYELRHSAFTSRNDWAMRSISELAGDDATADDVMVVMRIRREELDRRTTSPSFVPRWGDRYWIE